jgi:two-component system, cell cycle sensor histidine kinase and response regulator CckA
MTDAEAVPALPEVPGPDTFRLMVEAISECGIFLLDPAGRIASWNAGAERITGYSAIEAIGRPSASLCLPDGTAGAGDPSDLRPSPGRGPFDGERVLVRKDGSPFRAAFGVTELQHEGTLVGYAVTLRDVSQESHAEEELRRTATLLRAVAEGTTDAVFVKDRDGRYLLFNEAASRLVGRPVDEVLGKDDTALFDPESARKVMKRDRWVMEFGLTETEEEELTVAGITRTYLATKAPYRDEHGNSIGLIGISRDITERKRSEAALREREALYRIFTEDATDLVRLLDLDGRVIYASPAVSRLLGRVPAHQFDFIHPEDAEASRRWWQGALAGSQEGFDWRVRGADGEWHWLETWVSLVQHQGKPHVMTVCRDITERKRAEAALKESERRLAEAQRIAHLGHWENHLDEGRIALSDEVYRILGLRPQEGIHTLEELRERIHPDDRPIQTEAAARALGEGSPYELEYRVVRPDGEIRFVHSQGEVIRDSSGRPHHAFGTVQDVTERRRAEEALRASEARFRAFIDNISDAFFFCEEHGRIVDVNRQACASMGYTRDELIGKTPFDIDADATPAGSAEIGARLGAGETITFDTRHRRKDGSVFPVEVRIRPIVLEGRLCGLALARDITRRKQAEETLRRSEEMLRRAEAMAHVGAWSFEVQERVFLGTEEAYRLCGWEPRPHRQEDLSTIVHPDDRPRWQAAWQASLAGAPFELEHRLVVDGQVRWVHVRAEPEIDAEGRVVRIAGVSQDLTERKLLEAQLWQAQKMEAIGQLAGGVAHDFNNLLNVILGYSELLLLGLPASEPHRERVVAIRDAGERAARLTGQLLAFSRRAIVEPKVLDLNEVIDSSARMLRRLIGEDIILATVLSPRLSRVRIDPVQVEQLILNLGVNARDAMPRGGRLTLSTENVDVRKQDRRSDPDLKPGRYVRLSLADTGMGMTDEVKARIFEPFFTTKGVGRGTGLGLATVYGIVKQAGGQITVESQVGAGTTFAILLPAVPEADAPAGPESVPIAPRGTETVLLVEDEEGVRRVARLALEMQGYTVLEAAAGPEALRALDDHPEPVHLLLTDVVMPDLGGRELADAVRARRPGVKVLYTSGYTDDVAIRYDVSETDDAFLQKPFTALGLARKVREVLDGPS